MRILEAIQKFSYTSDNISTTEIIFNISKFLSLLDHGVTIYSTNYEVNQQKIEDLRQYNVKVLIFRIFWDIDGFIITPGLINNLSDIKKFDIIHLHNYRTFQNVILAYYAKLLNIPYVLQAEGSLKTFYQKKNSKILFDFFFGNQMIKNATKVIAVSEQETKQYLQLGVPNDKIVIIPFAIDPEEYTHLPDMGSFRKKYSIQRNTKIILYIGRIHKMKGLEILLSAYSEYVTINPDVLLVIAGPDDGYLDELNRLIKELHLDKKIIIPGPLYGPQKIEAFSDADIFILPSYHDDFGITALESMACGTPVIITDRCGAAEVVHNNGGLVINYDKNSLINAMTTLLSDNNLRIKYSELGRKIVLSNYNWNDIVGRLEKCYESCLSPR